MRTQESLRDHWVSRAKERTAVVTRRVCHCAQTAEEPCTTHGVETATKRVYNHPMDCDIGIDAQRRMEAAGRAIGIYFIGRTLRNSPPLQTVFERETMASP